MLVKTSTLGFSRIGPKRELKFALEKYWKGAIDSAELISQANAVEEGAWRLQVDAGIDRITVGDFCLYDNVVQWAEYLGIVPKRFIHMQPGMDRMFALCRGVDGAPALSMKKWIDSNYHYMVPEFDETSRVLPDFTSYISNVQRGIDKLGADRATPVVMGPVSFAWFVHFHTTTGQAEALLGHLIPVYKELLQHLHTMGVTEVQIHEPVLVYGDDNDLAKLFSKAYPAVFPSQRPSINMVSFFEDVGNANYKWITSMDEISVVSLDFTRGNNLELIEAYGFPSNKTLGVGIVDGRNVWKVDPSKIVPIIQKLLTKANSIRIQPSSSLQFIPWDLSCEKGLLGHQAGQVLSFSIQKLAEVALVAKVLEGQATLDAHESAWQTYRTALAMDKSVTERVDALTTKDFSRDEPYELRRQKQLKGVPLLPTTTIGSFPQTPAVRSLRARLNKGAITLEQYNAEIDKQIAYAIGVQEALGLDILVHGEAERTDMVEFFAQKMDGMLFSTNGWVQSFGSRCVRPPIFWSDISRAAPMTIREFSVAQSLTSKPVKGMLTGPVTILNWSFPRADISRKLQAMQIGLAIRDEIADLEKAGCTVIQVDEPALREGMPLRPSKKEEYLTWAVDSFLLSTAGAASKTQIHTHMCYCEFNDCMEAIDRLDTDVNSIENARSDNATLLAFKRIGYTKGLGPGTYDIHSPVVPTVDFIKAKLESFLECIEIEKLFVNPDCGLKTRTWPETIGALRNMIEANDAVRASLGLPTSYSQYKSASTEESSTKKSCCH